MTKVLRCGDVVAGCDAEVRAESEDEVLRQAGDHAREAHGMTSIDDATMSKIRDAVHDG